MTVAVHSQIPICVTFFRLCAVKAGFLPPENLCLCCVILVGILVRSPLHLADDHPTWPMSDCAEMTHHWALRECLCASHGFDILTVNFLKVHVLYVKENIKVKWYNNPKSQYSENTQIIHTQTVLPVRLKGLFHHICLHSTSPVFGRLSFLVHVLV